ncbi:MAG: glycosyltransferase [Elusimicrobia bacterium]|nr:glycosyltransferase [Elusimicrobiota bacterium]
MPSKPRVSVVIPAFNAAGTLAALLASLRDQTHPPAEVIVVDDLSGDETAKLAASLGAKVVPHSSNRGPGEARNTGVAAATGEIVMFTDADCIVPADWIERSLAFMKDRGARLTTSGYLGPVDAGLSAWFQHWEKRSREPFEPRVIRATNGHSLAVERALYLEVGGMEKIRTSEDFLFGLVVSERAAVHYDPDNGVYHRFRPGLGGFFRQKMLFAQNSVLCSRRIQSPMSTAATFSPWRTLLEVALTAGSLAAAAGALAFRIAGNGAAAAWLLAGALLLGAARAAPFLIFLRRRRAVVRARFGAALGEPRTTVPALLYLYSLPNLAVRDAATAWGMLRGAALAIVGR